VCNCWYHYCIYQLKQFKFYTSLLKNTF